MSPKFWAEAVVHAAKIRNHLPAPRDRNQSSLEAISGREPDVSHFRVFCCLGWYHILKDKWKKLYEKAEHRVVIYCFESKQFKPWLQSSNEAGLARDVTVDETTFPPVDWN